MLAAVCGVAGLAFGAWMDVYQWTLAARQDLDTYVAVAGTSLPYNLAHAAGNVVFCLLIGPAFLRALARYRRRFEVRWERSPAPVALGRRSRSCCSVPAAAVAATPAAAGGALSRAVPRTRTAASARRTGSELEPALQRLGGARARLVGPQPARREALAADARLPAS